MIFKQLISLATPPAVGDPEAEPRMFLSRSPVARNIADKTLESSSKSLPQNYCC